jgi:hypothetical protein
MKKNREQCINSLNLLLISEQPTGILIIVFRFKLSETALVILH